VNGAAVAESGKGKLSPSGFTGGAQAGYNWQRGHIVYGGEVDFGILDVGKRATQSGMVPVAFLGTQYTLTQKMTVYLGPDGADRPPGCQLPLLKPPVRPVAGALGSGSRPLIAERLTHKRCDERCCA
jgi:hypothetical protein